MGRIDTSSHRRKQIVWALYDCLAKAGSEKVTIKKIAVQAALPPGVIHYYFKSKDQIVSTLAEAIIEKYTSMLKKSLSKAGTAEQKLEYVIDFIVDILIFNRPLNRVFYNLIQLAFEREELGNALKKMFKDYREEFARILAQAGSARGNKIMGAALVAITEGFSIQLMVDPAALKKADVRRSIAQAVKTHIGSTKS